MLEGQILIFGFINGLPLALLALGFSSVYLITRIFHLAMAGIFICVPFVFMSLHQIMGSWFLASALAIIVGILLSILCEKFNHLPLENKKASAGIHLISSLGIYIIISQITVLIWGNDPQMLEINHSVYRRGELFITSSQVIILCVSFFSLILFSLWLKFSNIGLKLRALSSNSKEFSLQGYKINLFRMLIFAISGLLCSLASLIIAIDEGFSPHEGLESILLAIVATMIGGKNTFLGPVIGALLIGIFRSSIVWYFSAIWQNTFTFLLLAIFLLLRPQGIIGQKYRIEL